MTKRIRQMIAALLIPALFVRSARLPAQDDFAADMLRRLRAAMPTAVLTQNPADPDTIMAAPKDDPATTDPDKTRQINLHNIRRACAGASRAECRAMKTRFVRMSSGPEPVPTAAGLRLVVRPRGYIDATKAMLHGDRDHFPVVRSIGDDLFAVLAAASDDMIVLISRDGLRELGLSRAEGWAQAQRQTAAILPPMPTAAEIRPHPRVYQDFDNGAALLIDRAGWTALSKAVGGVLFATVAADDQVSIWVDPEEETLRSLSNMATETCDAHPRCISPHVYRFDDGRWRIAR